VGLAGVEAADWAGAVVENIELFNTFDHADFRCMTSGRPPDRERTTAWSTCRHKWMHGLGRESAEFRDALKVNGYEHEFRRSQLTAGPRWQLTAGTRKLGEPKPWRIFESVERVVT
jgi:hypothetical protein